METLAYSVEEDFDHHWFNIMISPLKNKSFTLVCKQFGMTETEHNAKKVKQSLVLGMALNQQRGHGFNRKRE